MCCWCRGWVSGSTGSDRQGGNTCALEPGADCRGVSAKYEAKHNGNAKGANLSKAKLHGADFRGVSLTKADLTGANLFGADLDGAIFCNTSMPDGSINSTNC